MKTLTLKETEIAQARNQYAGQILRETTFAATHREVSQSHLAGVVAMSPLGENKYELLLAPEGRDVRYSRRENPQIADAGDVVLVRVTLPTEGGNSLEMAAYAAYEKVFVEAKARAMQLLRVWHYIPAILRVEDSLENYRWHNLGRSRAWQQFGPWQGDEPVVPAATGIGVESGPYVLEVLLTVHPVMALQNPRQVPFVKYGQQYGPKPPFCARGAVHQASWGIEVWLSGTASVRRQYSWYKGDPVSQVRETVRNLKALVSDANLAPYGVSGVSLESLQGCRVYVKDPRHQEAIEREFAKLVPGLPFVCAQTDVCRPDLLLEIEGMVSLSPNR